MIDMLDQHQERASIGAELYNLLLLKNIEVVLLRHSFFEIAAVLKNLTVTNRQYKFGDNFQLQIAQVVDIDEAFVNSYLNFNLPYCKGADWMLLCYSFKEQIEFITQDERLYNACRTAGISVYDISEYVSKYK